MKTPAELLEEIYGPADNDTMPIEVTGRLLSMIPPDAMWVNDYALGIHLSNLLNTFGPEAIENSLVRLKKVA